MNPSFLCATVVLVLLVIPFKVSKAAPDANNVTKVMLKLETVKKNLEHRYELLKGVVDQPSSYISDQIRNNEKVVNITEILKNNEKDCGLNEKINYVVKAIENKTELFMVEELRLMELRLDLFLSLQNDVIENFKNKTEKCPDIDVGCQFATKEGLDGIDQLIHHFNQDRPNFAADSQKHFDGVRADLVEKNADELIKTNILDPINQCLKN